MSDLIKNLTSDSFASAIQTPGTPVLVDFWAPWCGPCKSIAPILEELAQEWKDQVQVTKVNVDDCGEIAGQYNIRAIPTLLLFKDGKVVETIVGMVGKPELSSKVKAHL